MAEVTSWGWTGLSQGSFLGGQGRLGRTGGIGVIRWDRGEGRGTPLAYHVYATLQKRC